MTTHHPELDELVGPPDRTEPALSRFELELIAGTLLEELGPPPAGMAAAGTVVLRNWTPAGTAGTVDSSMFLADADDALAIVAVDAAAAVAAGARLVVTVWMVAP